MKKILLILSIFSCPAIYATIPYNSIIARINSDVITQNQLDEQSAFLYHTNFKGKVFSDKEKEILHDKILEQVIMDKIQAQLALKQGINVTDADIDSAISNIVANKKTDILSFNRQLKQDGVSLVFFRQIVKTQIINQKLKQANVDSKIIVTEQDVANIMNSDVYKNQINYDLSSIVLSIPQGATSEDLLHKDKLSQEIHKKLLSGSDFAKLSIEYSDAPNAASGGALGLKSSLGLPPEIISALSGLKSGDVSSVVKLPIGFFIFKINNVITVDKPALAKLAEYRVRHILIKVNELNSEKDSYTKILQLYNRIINAEHPQDEFVIVAKQYSQDASAINGGDLSWIKQGDTVPEFENTVLNLPLNVISKPVKTQFGWHIIELTDKRNIDNSKKQAEAQVRMDIVQSKEAILYAEWLQSLRQGASVSFIESVDKYETK